MKIVQKIVLCTAVVAVGLGYYLSRRGADRQGPNAVKQNSLRNGAAGEKVDISAELAAQGLDKVKLRQSGERLLD